MGVSLCFLEQTGCLQGFLPQGFLIFPFKQYKQTSAVIAGLLVGQYYKIHFASINDFLLIISILN